MLLGDGGGEKGVSQKSRLPGEDEEKRDGAGWGAAEPGGEEMRKSSFSLLRLGHRRPVPASVSAASASSAL